MHGAIANWRNAHDRLDTVELAPFAGAIALRAWSPDWRLAATTLVTLLATLRLHMKEIALLTRNQWSMQAILICCCLAAADEWSRARRESALLAGATP